jgi:hypothetical protein
VDCKRTQIFVKFGDSLVIVLKSSAMKFSGRLHLSPPRLHKQITDKRNETLFEEVRVIIQVK